jgi:hypothetical protein
MTAGAVRPGEPSEEEVLTTALKYSVGLDLRGADSAGAQVAAGERCR